MPVASVKKIGENALLGLWHIEEPVETLSRALQLTSAERDRFASIKTERRQREWLACRNLLKEMLGQNTEILRAADGKPSLSDTSYAISMSHSGAYASVYLSENAAAGVDVQQFKPSLTAGAYFFIHRQEESWVDVTDNRLLHLIWSTKEAAFKYASDAALDFSKDMEIMPFEINQNRPLLVKLGSGAKQIQVWINYIFFEDYVLTWTI